MVVLTGRRAEKLEQAAQGIRERGGNAKIQTLDASDPAAVDRAVNAIAGQHGGQIDILVNAAGFNIVQRRWDNLTIEGWRQVISANLDTVLFCTRAVLPFMRARKDGLIINVSSWAGRHTLAGSGAGYNAAKQAAMALTETVNMEEGVHGIRACAVCPGEVNTPLMDRRQPPPSAEERRKMLQADDLGRCIRWVAEQGAHVCINEILISPTWNRAYPR